jgi:hypothetical protein
MGLGRRIRRRDGERGETGHAKTGHAKTGQADADPSDQGGPQPTPRPAPSTLLVHHRGLFLWRRLKAKLRLQLIVGMSAWKSAVRKAFPRGGPHQ